MEVFEHNIKLFKIMIHKMYINCWHLGEFESMAMWKGYGGGPYGVAIKSTYGALDESLPDYLDGIVLDDGNKIDEPIFLGPVEYIDHKSTSLRLRNENNVFSPFMYKSLAYRNECELRAVYNSTRMPIGGHYPPGEYVDIDLNVLIEEIVISPLAPAWFTALIPQLCEQYGFNFSIEQSAVSGDPVY